MGTAAIIITTCGCVMHMASHISQGIEDNKLLLKAKYDEAKALGQAVNASKARINELKGHIEMWRAQRAAACEWSRAPAVTCVNASWGGWPAHCVHTSFSCML